MGLWDMSKDILTLVQKTDNLDLVRKLMELQTEALRIQEESLNFKAENLKLKETLAVRGKLRKGLKDAYWLLEDDSADEGPYCVHCWDVDHRLVHLYEMANSMRQCPECGVNCEPGQPPR